MTSPALGLRQRKKEATRRALHEAAVRLAAERGPEQVTVEAIADAVDVSRRTFSNYFASKDDALLHSDTERLERFVGLVVARPEGEGAWTALREAAFELLATETDTDPAWLAQMRLVRSHPSLAAARVARWGTSERALAQVLVERVGGEDPELVARALAASFLALFRTAGQVWNDRPGTDLAGVLRQVLDAVAAPGDAGNT